jgi:hypothetical protein
MISNIEKVNMNIDNVWRVISVGILNELNYEQEISDPFNNKLGVMVFDDIDYPYLPNIRYKFITYQKITKKVITIVKQKYFFRKDLILEKEVLDLGVLRSILTDHVINNQKIIFMYDYKKYNDILIENDIFKDFSKIMEVIKHQH